jgi:D-erythrulose 1-phosphate 3-epimerase
MTKITLGINNCFACKRWPEPERWAQIVSDVLGLNLVQFSFDLLDPRTIEPTRMAQVDKIVEAVNKYNLELHSTFTGLAAYCFNMLSHPDKGMRLDALDWFQKAVDLSCRLGAKAIGGHLGALSTQDYADAGRRSYLAGELRESIHSLAKQAKNSMQEVLLWEPMPVNRERPSTVSDALELYEFVNQGSPLPVKYCLDLGHTCAFDNHGPDLDPYYWIKTLGKYSPVIHLQQSDGKGDHHWPFTKEYNQMGIVDRRKVINAIETSEAEEVYLVLEVIHAFEANENKVLDELKESVDYWQGVIA